jgi:hypothetical protein
MQLWKVYGWQLISTGRFKNVEEVESFGVVLYQRYENNGVIMALE